MSRTASLIVRIIALLAAIGAGVAWYLIYQLQIERAMKETSFLVQDPRFSNAADKAPSIYEGSYPSPKKQFLEVQPKDKEQPEFVKRLSRLPYLYEVIKDMRDEIAKHIEVIVARDNEIKQHKQTIADREATINQLETDKANLTRERDDLTGKLSAANGKIASLETEKQQLQATIVAKDEQISKMFTKEQYDEIVAARNKAEDELTFVVGRYTKLWLWAQTQSGLKPPYPKNPLDKTSETQMGPKPKEITPPVPTRIVAVDPRKGLLTISLGRESAALKRGTIYDMETGGLNVGRLRVSEILDGMTTADILPGANIRLLVRGAILNLSTAEAKVSKGLPDATRAAAPGVTGVSTATAPAGGAAPAAIPNAAPAPAPVPDAEVAPAPAIPAPVPAGDDDAAPVPPPPVPAP